MQRVKGYSLAVISAVSYGLIPLFILPIKQSHFSLDTTLFYRFLIAGLILLGILIFKKEKLKINRRELGVLALLGLFYGLSSDLLFMGYDYLTPGIASTLLFIYPIIVAIIMVFFFKEKIQKLTLISLLITIVGVYILSLNQSSFSIQFLGLIICLFSALFYALYIITVNQSKMKVSGWKITFYSLLFTSIYYLTKIIFLGGNLEIPNFQLFSHFLIFALVTTVISMTTLVYAIQLIGSTPTSIMGALEPVVAVLISVLIFSEILTKNLIFGVILILIGVTLNVLSNYKKPSIK